MCFFFALFSKEIAAPLPLIALCLFFFVQRSDTSSCAGSRSAVFLILMLFAVLVAYLAFRLSLYSGIGGYNYSPLRNAQGLDKILVILYIIFDSSYLMLFPINKSLYSAVYSGLSTLTFIMLVLVMVVLLIQSVANSTKAKKNTINAFFFIMLFYILDCKGILYMRCFI